MVVQTAKPRFKRKQLLVDYPVQGALLLRVALYWTFTLTTIALMLLCWRIVTGPARLFYLHFDDMWFHYGPALIAACLMLPIVLLDIAKLSNRFVGPLVRLRRSLRLLANGQPVAPIQFREGDFWQEIADEFNAVAARLQKTEVKELQTTTSE
jgi:hypothetical protein